jgi:hypothetical protein
MPEGNADPTVQVIGKSGHPRPVVMTTGLDDRHPERRVPFGERGGRGEIGLGQAEQRGQPAVVRRYEAAVDEPEPWLGIGESDDNDEQLGVGDHGTFDGIGVIGRASQQAGALGDPHDPGEGVRPTGHITHQGNPITHHDGASADVSAPDGDHLGVPRPAGVPAAVDGDHESVDGILVRRSGAGPGPRAAAGTDPDVVLVEAVVPRPARTRADR